MATKRRSVYERVHSIFLYDHDTSRYRASLTERAFNNLVQAASDAEAITERLDRETDEMMRMIINRGTAVKGMWFLWLEHRFAMRAIKWFADDNGFEIMSGAIAVWLREDRQAMVRTLGRAAAKDREILDGVD